MGFAVFHHVAAAVDAAAAVAPAVAVAVVGQPAERILVLM